MSPGMCPKARTHHSTCSMCHRVGDISWGWGPQLGTCRGFRRPSWLPSWLPGAYVMCPSRCAHRWAWLMHVAATATCCEVMPHHRVPTTSLAAWMATGPVARRLEPCLSCSMLCCVMGVCLMAWTCHLACPACPVGTVTCPTSGDTMHGQKLQLGHVMAVWASLD